MQEEPPKRHINDASHYYSPERDMGANRPVTNVAKSAAKGTAIIQLVLLPVGILLIPFGGAGVLVLVADWVWGLVTVVQTWRKPGVVYVRQHPRR